MNAYDTMMARLAAGGVVLLDGGTGTELERRGVPMDPDAWCGPATGEHADVLEEIHRAYIAAGAEIITANTFSGSRLMLAGAGLGDQVETLARQAVATAFAARGERADVLIAGSMSHQIPVVRGGDRSRRDDRPDAATMSAAFHELSGILADSGCDLLLLEMMYAPDRMAQALPAARACGLPVWLGLSGRYGADGALLSFDRDEDLPFDDVLAGIDFTGIDAVGIMHTPVTLCGEALEAIARHWPGPRFVYPDSGYFRMPHWQFEDVIAPADLHTAAADWVAAGASAIGGCCGLSPEHIAALAPLKR